jgi:hypothetical protein
MDRNKIFTEYGDKIRRKEPHHSFITPQASHPPRTVAGIEAFDQIAFHKT